MSYLPGYEILTNPPGLSSSSALSEMLIEIAIWVILLFFVRSIFTRTITIVLKTCFILLPVLLIFMVLNMCPTIAIGSIIFNANDHYCGSIGLFNIFPCFLCSFEHTVYPKQLKSFMKRTLTSMCGLSIMSLGFCNFNGQIVLSILENMLLILVIAAWGTGVCFLVYKLVNFCFNITFEDEQKVIDEPKI